MTGMTAVTARWPALARPQWPMAATAALGVAAALAFGAALPRAPLTTIVLLVLVPLVVLTPVAALSVLIAVTVLVPFGVQDTFAVIGGRGTPGLLLIDALLLLGLCRVGWMLARRHLAVDRHVLVGVGLALGCTAALVFGVLHGAAISDAGHEARRVVLGVGTFLLALPVVRDPVARRKLGPVLVVVGLALGVWGLAQWLLDAGYTTTAADVGVRPGVSLTSAGHGQLQGGLFAYPVAVTLAWAALISGGLRPAVRATLTAVLVLNIACLVLTYERTFWVVAALACALVAVWAGSEARRRGLRWAAVWIGVLFCIAVLAPSEIVAASERLLSIGQLKQDNSFSYRVIESQAVMEAIRQQPLVGSGFGVPITWGADGLFATRTTPFTHNGFLWLTWRFGIPAALAVFGAILWAVFRRMPGGDSARWRTIRLGARASTLAILLVNMTFPSVNALGITALLGLLVAICFSPPDVPDDVRRSAAAEAAS